MVGFSCGPLIVTVGTKLKAGNAPDYVKAASLRVMTVGGLENKQLMSLHRLFSPGPHAPHQTRKMRPTSFKQKCFFSKLSNDKL